MCTFNVEKQDGTVQRVKAADAISAFLAVFIAAVNYSKFTAGVVTYFTLADNSVVMVEPYVEPDDMDGEPFDKAEDRLDMEARNAAFDAGLDPRKCPVCQDDPIFYLSGQAVRGGECPHCEC